MANKPIIFISYSHDDERDKDYVVEHLSVAAMQGKLDLWDDRQIAGGGDWKADIDEKLATASVAVLLVSRKSLTSRFILDHEVKSMLQRRAEDGLEIYPIVVHDCDWAAVEWLKKMNLRPRDGKSLDKYTMANRNTVMKEVSQEIRRILEARAKGMPSGDFIEPEVDGPLKGPAEAPKAPIEAPQAPTLISIPTADWPDFLGEPPDSFLLRPESRCVRFHDHAKGWRREIVGWAMEPEARIVLRLQTGRGGAGKTRLAIAVCEALAGHGWETGFLRSGHDLDRELPALLDLKKPCLMVIDYAETRVDEIVDLTRKILYRRDAPTVRLLLLARDGGDWWNLLRDQARRVDDSQLEAVLSNPSTKQGPYPMGQHPIDDDLRPTLFKEALADLAKATGRAAGDIAVPDLSADHFRRLLFLHLAALASLRGENVSSDRELLQTGLGHERTYWRRLLAQGGLAEAWHQPAFEQGLALLTLLGGRTSAKETKATIGRTPRLVKAADGDRQRIFDLLRRLYPDQGGVRGLEPDLLGERLVAECLALDDELLDAAFGGDATAEDATSAFTILARLAQHHADDRQWLALALERYLKHWPDQAFDVAKETGAPMPELMIEASRQGDRKTRRSMAEQLANLPEKTINLQDLAVEVTVQKLKLLTEKGQKKGGKQASRLHDAYRSNGLRLQAIGEYAEAIESFEKALYHATTLAKSGSLSDRHRLALAHNYLANCQDDAARFEDAYAHAVAGERLSAQLASKEPDKFTELWAGMLYTLSHCLDVLGRFEEALETAEQSEAISRKVALRKSDSSQHSWALSLDLLSTRLPRLGNFEGAIQHSECAETIVRELVAKQPDAFSSDYAKVLSNLSLHLRNLDRFEEALEKMQQAESITRDLAAKQPDAHQLAWAYELANLSEAFVNFKRPIDAIRTGRQAVTLLPDLKRKPGDFRTLIAEGFCLRVMAEALLQADERTTALAAAKKAANSLEAAFAERPDHVAEHYVQAIVTSAKCRQNTVDVDGALALLEKGTTAIKPLFEKRPRALQREMLRLIDGFRMIDPSAIDDRVPATILTTLGDLPPFRGTRSSLP